MEEQEELEYRQAYRVQRIREEEERREWSFRRERRSRIRNENRAGPVGEVEVQGQNSAENLGGNSNIYKP